MNCGDFYTIAMVKTELNNESTFVMMLCSITGKIKKIQQNLVKLICLLFIFNIWLRIYRCGFPVLPEPGFILVVMSEIQGFSRAIHGTYSRIFQDFSPVSTVYRERHQKLKTFFFHVKK